MHTSDNVLCHTCTSTVQAVAVRTVRSNVSVPRAPGAGPAPQPPVAYGTPTMPQLYRCHKMLAPHDVYLPSSLVPRAAGTPCPPVSVSVVVHGVEWDPDAYVLSHGTTSSGVPLAPSPAADNTSFMLPEAEAALFGPFAATLSYNVSAHRTFVSSTNLVQRLETLKMSYYVVAWVRVSDCVSHANLVHHCYSLSKVLTIPILDCSMNATCMY